MTEDDALVWLRRSFGDGAVDRLQLYVQLLIEENEQQNLIAPATVPTIWARHILDSAQLLSLAPRSWGTWLDVGTGAGLPGLVVAILTNGRIWLAEPRARRVEFLNAVISRFNLSETVVLKARVESVETGAVDVISARAVAPLDTLLESTSHLRHSGTRYVLPRGRNAATEIDAAAARWKGVFHVEHSLTDPESLIVVADGVRA
jgi:16S rRNA (guanine527-N7)-methyltransferase